MNDPQATRQRIVNAAYEAFTARGYAHTGVQELKQAAGVSGGAFSYHFPTKKALALAVIMERIGPAVEATWIVPVRTAQTGLSGVARVFGTVIDELEGRGSVTGCPLNNLVIELSGKDADIRAALDAIFGKWRAALAGRFREDEKLGILAVDNIDDLSAAVISLYSGGMAQAKARQDASPLVQSWRQTERFLRTLYDPGLMGKTGTPDAGDTAPGRGHDG